MMALAVIAMQLCSQSLLGRWKSKAPQGAERPEAKLIKDDEIKAGEAFRNRPGLGFGFLLFGGIDPFDAGEEPHPEEVMRDGLDFTRGFDTGLARVRTAARHDVLARISECAARPLAPA